MSSFCKWTTVIFLEELEVEFSGLPIEQFNPSVKKSKCRERPISFLLDHCPDNLINSSRRSDTHKKIKNTTGSSIESGNMTIPAIKGSNILRKGNRLNKAVWLNHEIRFCEIVAKGDLSKKSRYYHH